MFRTFLILNFLLLLLNPYSLLSHELYIDSLAKLVKSSDSDYQKIQLLGEISDTYRYVEVEKSSTFADSALALSTQIGHDQGIADNLIRKASISFAKRDVKLGEEYLTRAFNLFQANNNHEGIAKSYYHMGVKYLRQRDIQKAEKFFRQSINTSDKYKHTYHKALSLIKLAEIKSKTGMPDSAVFFVSNAISLLEEIREKPIRQVTRDIGVAYNSLGNIYRFTGDLENGIDNYYKALNIMEQISDYGGMILCFNGIANIYLAQGQYNKAENYYTKAYSYVEKYNIKQSKLSILQNMGAMYLGLNNYESAEKTLANVVEAALEMNNFQVVINAKINLGRLYYEQGKKYKALKLYKEVQGYSKNNNDLRGEAIAKGRVGATYYSIYKDGEVGLDSSNSLIKHAIINLDEAVILAEKVGMRDQLSAFHEQLYLLNKKIGQSGEALKHHEMYISISDSINREAVNVKIANLEAVRENLQKDKEAALLKENIESKQRVITLSILGAGVVIALLLVIFIENRKLRKLKNSLSEMNGLLEDKVDEKTQDLLKANQDLLKANQEKVDLLNLFAHTFRTKVMHMQGYISTYPIIFSSIEEIDSQMMAFIEQCSSDEMIALFNNRREYRNNLISCYDETDKVLKKVTGLMNDMQTAIEIKENKYHIDKQLIPVETFYYFIKSFDSYGLISPELSKLISTSIPELESSSNIKILADESNFIKILKIIVENSFEYTNYAYLNGDREPEIKIQLKKLSDKIVVSILDNGIGFSDKALKNIGNIINNGADIYNTFDGIGLGLFIATEIMRQFNGVLKAYNNSDFGATVELHFPILKDKD